MTERKQVMDMRSTTSGISQMESNEQQRNWSDEQWKNKAKDSLANYDPTRASLNFEVTKGGVVQPIDKSKSIAQKMAENLAARGIKDPNANPKAVMQRRTLAQFVFGGNIKCYQYISSLYIISTSSPSFTSGFVATGGISSSLPEIISISSSFIISQSLNACSGD